VMDSGKVQREMSKKQVSRRKFIIGAGGAAAAAALAGGFGLPLVGRAGGQDGDDSGGAGGDGNLTSTGHKRQWVMVIDLRKCEGCVTIDEPPQCAEACIKGHFVPDGQQWIEVFEEKLPGGGSYFMPAPCMQCQNAPCTKVCPVGATYHNDEGIVLINHERCIGCRMCMAACLYQRRFFNWGEPKVPAEAYFAEYSPEYPVPARKGTVIKCMMCAHLTSQGKLPHCVEGCPMNAIYLGDLVEDVATNGEDIVVLSKFLSDNGAYRYKEKMGTEPRVYYIRGHGQEFDRDSDDERDLKPGPNWDERQSGEPPHPEHLTLEEDAQ
jgi:dimethyl sulfoxide reductase iron-sulfur subunit